MSARESVKYLTGGALDIEFYEEIMTDVKLLLMENGSLPEQSLQHERHDVHRSCLFVDH